MALSQCLDDLPIASSRFLQTQPDHSPLELYSEAQRLALEELILGGREQFLNFLRKECIPNFLSDKEIAEIQSSVETLPGEDGVAERSSVCSVDCSSLTYFPDQSDVEPPLLELGWPAFTSNSYRGVTRAVTHFQPSYGEHIYSCKEAVRRLIRSAKEVIALVTDSFTDLDIFRDLQEACIKRRVPVYILLDQSCTRSFLQMCKNLGVQLDELQQMRVRTITGGIYYTRSGAKIVGKVHERFMLIDGNRVATGSYRFTWSDGRLNSSNLLELSGQVSEHFDEQFRILYAQSKPLSPKSNSSFRNSGIYEHLVNNTLLLQDKLKGNLVSVEVKRLCSTPNRVPIKATTPGKEAEELQPVCSRVSEASTIGEESPKIDDLLQEQDGLDEVHLGENRQSTEVTTNAEVNGSSSSTPCCSNAATVASKSENTCHAFTQTNTLMVEIGCQTDVNIKENICRSTATQKSQESSEGSNPSSCSSQPYRAEGCSHAITRISETSLGPDSSLRVCFRKLTKERQYHYSSIRSKLDHMVSLLSHRRELVNLTYLAFNHRPYKVKKLQDQSAQPSWLRDASLRQGRLVQTCLK
uniref:Family with sequence similarity 83 member D n=1 Tax=Erpetoichthys calabaricus TaxID=27687 RepID=A0A8C4S9E2_ERPCA